MTRWEREGERRNPGPTGEVRVAARARMHERTRGIVGTRTVMSAAFLGVPWFF